MALATHDHPFHPLVDLTRPVLRACSSSMSFSEDDDTMWKLLRRLRGAVGMGLTWALGWAVAGAIVRTIFGPGTGDLPYPIQFALFGFFSGVTFSGILTLVAGRRRFDEVSIGGFAALGAVGGAVVYGLLAATAGPAGEPLRLLPVFILTGSASAAGALLLARAAEEPHLLDDGDDLDAIEGGAGE